MKKEVEAWNIAFEHTRQLNKIHNIQIDLVKYSVDLYSVENINKHFEIVWELIKKKKPNLKQVRKTLVNDLEDHKYCFPIREENYSNGNHCVCSLVDDVKFFSFENRELALTLIFEDDAHKLKSMGYLKWDEHKLIDFMSKRLIKKTKLKI